MVGKLENRSFSSTVAYTAVVEPQKRPHIACDSIVRVFCRFGSDFIIYKSSAFYTHIADMIASNRFLKNTSEYVSFLRFLAYPASTLTIHPRYKPYDYRTTTYTAVIQQYTKYTIVTIM